MKIGLVCPYDLGRFGGVQDQAIKLRSWLVEAGHDAVLVGPGTAGPPGAHLVGPTIIVPSNGAVSPISMRPGVWRLVAEAVEGCDVVHVHEPLMPAVSLQTTRKLNVPLVGTFHADVPKAISRLLTLARRPVRRILSRLQVATAVSPVAATVLEGLTPYRIVPNGIDVALYREGPESRVEGRVMFLGRDDPRKGLDVLLEAWPAVRDAVPDAELVVAGATRPPLGGVTFVGRVGEDEKRSLLRQSAIFAAPNLGGESFGIILAEAMAAGCAVVASSIPAFEHVLGDAGRMVPPGSAAALAEAVAGLLRDEEARRDLARRAGARVERFDKASVVAGYLAAYRDAIG